MDALVTAPAPLSDAEFAGFRDFAYDAAGIHLTLAKKALVAGRLSGRLRHQGISRYADYLALIARDGAERQVALDLLTTNETYFFREPEHFTWLATELAPALRRRSDVRVWCGAASSGEEPWSLAMTLANALGHTRFELVASDISARMLDKCRAATYDLEDAELIPAPLRAAWCLKGVGSQAGRFTFDPVLRARVRFEQVNLCAPLPSSLGDFDLVFLRNVMIYFDAETKREVVERIVPRLKPGGHFVVSHSESLHGVTDRLRMLRPSIYARAED